MTPLKGADNKVYALAQGNLSVNGYSVKSGKTDSKAIKNHLTVGRIPNGGTIEKEILNPILNKSYLDLILKNPDFTTAYRLKKTINEQFGEELAKAIDSNTVRVDIPISLKDNPIKFIAIIENLDVKVDTPAKIVINERTGTIIIGKNVTISSVAISHGNLNIVVEENQVVTQPSLLSLGTTEKTNTTNIKVTEDKADFSLLQDKVTLEDLVKALNSLGVSTRDMISIIQAIKESGALQAELEII
jgi:flagellar P-ring protein precursor FlgI